LSACIWRTANERQDFVGLAANIAPPLSFRVARSRPDGAT
jgi:hypothetical protein